ARRPATKLPTPFAPRCNRRSTKAPVGLRTQIEPPGSVGEPVPVRVADRLRAVANPGLGEEVVDVALHGRLADEEPRGDLAVREPLGDQGEDFGLPRRQL